MVELPTDHAERRELHVLQAQVALGRGHAAFPAYRIGAGARHLPVAPERDPDAHRVSGPPEGEPFLDVLAGRARAPERDDGAVAPLAEHDGGAVDDRHAVNERLESEPRELLPCAVLEETENEASVGASGHELDEAAVPFLESAEGDAFDLAPRGRKDDLHPVRHDPDMRGRAGRAAGEEKRGRALRRDVERVPSVSDRERFLLRRPALERGQRIDALFLAELDRSLPRELLLFRRDEERLPAEQHEKRQGDRRQRSFVHAVLSVREPGVGVLPLCGFARPFGPLALSHGIVAAAREGVTPEDAPHRERRSLEGTVPPERVLCVPGTGRSESAHRWMTGRNSHSVYVQNREADPCEDTRYHPFVKMSPALPNELSTSSKISWNVHSFGRKEATNTIQRFCSPNLSFNLPNISLISLFALLR